MAQRKRRKQRKQRQRAARVDSAPAPDPSSSGYARAREKDAAARAALVPLEEGERPRALTIGAIYAGALFVANLVALILNYEPGEPRKSLLSVFSGVLLAAAGWGMWHVRYWAVLGMQVILAFAVVGGTTALVAAKNWAAVLLLLAIILPAGILFWFLIKAMARIQMPEWPGR